ncbi:MAG TPA: response regulator [Ktedonobacterales bacterium]
MRPPPGGDHQPARLPARAGEDPRPPMAVLFLDPDLQAAHPLANALRDRCIVAVVGSAAAALAAISQRMPDIVVLELDLPDVAGVRMLAQLRGTPATRHILLMVLTHRSGIQDKIAAFEAGADDYLVKPITPDVFRTHIQLVSRFRRVLPQ